MSHSPDNPFGCPQMWGPRLGVNFSVDELRHICNLPSDHDGPHECKCGDRR